MRPSPVRALRRAMLALVLVSCTSDRLTGPQPLSRATTVTLVPGAAPMITEFMSNPAGDDTQGEWIEVYNPSTEAVDLKDYLLASGPTVLKPGGTPTDAHKIATSVVIPPGGYVVLGNNADEGTNNGLHVDYQYGTTPVLNNSNTDWITLKAPNGVLADSVAYSASTVSSTFARTITTPSFTPSASTSRAVIDLSADNSIAGGSNWANSISTFGTAGDRGTPGEANFGGEATTVTVRATSFVTPGTTFRITAGATDVDGKPSLTTFTWTSSDPTIASIDPATGVVTGILTGAGGQAGIVTVTATSANGVSGTGTVFVVNPGDVGSISISVNDPAQVPAGFTKPAFPTTKTTTGATVTPALVWSSSDPAIATVSDLGYITGVAAGKVEIRATAPNGVFGVVPFTVIPADAPTTAVYRNHLEFGAPVDVGSAGTILLSKRQYVESYDPARGGPRWVSWNLNKSQFGSAPRCDCFSADLTLPADVYHVVDFDYRNGGYDRGHMVQSESRTTTDQENAATFLLTNILPQGAENNQGPWSKLENELNDDVRTGGKEIYVVAGGIYASDAPTLKNEGKVAIPDYTWKVAVIVGAEKGLADVHSLADLQVIAVKMPNLTTTGTAASSVGMRNNPWSQYVTTVDQLEIETGLDLLSALPDDIERQVEANDRTPIAAVAAVPAGVEGSSFAFDASGSSDPDGDQLTYSWTFGDGQTATGVAPTHVYTDDGTYTATVTVSDPKGLDASATTSVTVTNAAPVITTFTLSSTLGTPGSSVGMQMAATDAGVGDLLSMTIDWGDAPAGTYAASSIGTTPASASRTHVYAAAGVYTVTLTVTDGDGGVARQTYAQPVVIYDPARWVNGSGWLMGPGGKTTFSSTVRYASGATQPSGDTQYALNDGSFTFTATGYDWLVVRDGRAQFTGRGTIAGRPGTVRFLATELDGSPDAIRLKVWDASGVIYDNAPGAEISSLATPISGGNINIH